MKKKKFHAIIHKQEAKNIQQSANMVNPKKQALTLAVVFFVAALCLLLLGTLQFNNSKSLLALVDGASFNQFVLVGV